MRWPRAIPWLILALAPLRSFAADVPLIADTYISGATPALNFGALANLNVGNATANNVALLKFDLSVLPAAGVARAILRVFVNKVGTPGSIDVLTVSSPWVEGAITGQFPPVLGGILATAVPVTTSASYIAIDVTTIVQNQVSLAAFFPNNGFAIVADASTPATSIFLDSKESTSTSHPATLDVTLAGPAGAQGPAGPVGAMGTAGPTGPQGLPGSSGAAGPQGLQGIAGIAGAQGPAGVAGAQGVPGAQGIPGQAGQTGATGTAGPIGLVWRGAWNPDPNFLYAANDAVSFNGSSYISNSINSGEQPDINAQTWTLLASAGVKGTAGTPGTPGVAGVPGAVGPQGFAGPAGAQGPVGVTGPPGATGTAGASASFTLPANPYFSTLNIATADKAAAGPASGVLAVTSLTITSFASTNETVEIVLGEMTQASCGGTLAKAHQPDFMVSVPAGQTIHLTYPAPLVFNGAAAGIPTCVDAGFVGGSTGQLVSIAINGYVI